MDTPTPMEDAMLLHVVRVFPRHLLELQWFEVARSVALATRLPQRTAEETKRRFETLAKIVYAPPVANQRREATPVVTSNSNRVPSWTAVSQPVTYGPVATVSAFRTAPPNAASHPRTPAGAHADSTLKRKRDAGETVRKYFLLDDDEALLRAVAMVKPGLSFAQWQRVADYVSAETVNKFSLKRCQSRYKELMKLTRPQISHRFGVSVALVRLVEAAQQDFVARPEEASATLEPAEQEEDETLPKPKKAKPKASKAPQRPRPAVASKSKATSKRPQPPPQDQAASPEPATAPPPSERPPTQNSVVPGIPEVSDDCSSCDAPVPGESEEIDLSHEPEEPLLRDEIKELKTMLNDLGAKIQQTQAENTQLKKDVETLQETVRGLNGVKHEVASLRSRLEEGKSSSLLQTLQMEQFRKTALDQIIRKNDEADKVLEAGKQQIDEIAAKCAQCNHELQCQVESLSKSLVEDIRRVRAMQEQSSETTAAFGEEINRIRDSQKQNVDIIQTVTGVMGRIKEGSEATSKAIESMAAKVSGFEAAQEESRKAIQSSTAEIVRVEATTEANTKAIGALKTDHCMREEAERQRQTIFYEMVEAETLGREKLAGSIEKWKKHYESTQEAREESLLWFQDEIREQLHTLRGQMDEQLMRLKRDTDNRVTTTEANHESSLQAYEDKLLLMARSQDETRCLSLDQYVQTTIQLHELRDTIATTIEKERRDRSQDFRTLLQHVQQLVDVDREAS